METAINIARNELARARRSLDTIISRPAPRSDHPRNGKLRAGRDAGVAGLRHDRRSRGHECGTGVLGATARELRIRRAASADFIAQFRRLRLPAYFRGRAREQSVGSGHLGSRNDIQTPYWFNLHRRQVGNFTVVGPTGSGKTVALGFLLAQAMRITPRPRIAFFDKDRGADPLIRAMGGSSRS